MPTARRRVVLQAVVPGRRYVIGKGEGCDICVNGTYASRRHAEIWLEGGTWWVADAGSTNGLRIESRRRRGRCRRRPQPTALGDGARLVLSARARARRATIRGSRCARACHAPSRITPDCHRLADDAAHGDPPRRPPPAPRCASPAVQGGSPRTLELRESDLPLTVGRSRNQALVIDRQHDSVSGHHLDILEIDPQSALVLVHGDNGVLLDGQHHGPGTRVCWHAGTSMVLGASAYRPRGLHPDPSRPWPGLTAMPHLARP